MPGGYFSETELLSTILAADLNRLWLAKSCSLEIDSKTGIAVSRKIIGIFLGIMTAKVVAIRTSKLGAESYRFEITLDSPGCLVSSKPIRANSPGKSNFSIGKH